MRKPRKSSGRMASKGFPNPVDVHVGQRIRQRRTLLGMSQQKVAEALGLTFQQVQKYEWGTNRVSSGRLFELARILNIPIPHFFEGMEAGVADKSPSRLMGVTESKMRTYVSEPDPLAKRESIDLVRAYYQIADPRVRKRIYELTKAVAKAAA
jgi:transcriptional regulator with XRE-family HTH domain